MLRNHRRIISFVLLGVLILAVAAVSGCGSSKQADKTTPSNSNLSGTLTIAGSTSVQPFSEILAEQFMKKNPQVQINVQGGGSGPGIQAAISGAANIGSSSRDLKDEEKQDLVVSKIALDGIAVITNPANKVTNIKIEDLRNVFAGNIKNWKDLGGDDAVITVVSREEGSGTRSAFEELVMNKVPVAKNVIVQNSTGAVKTTIAGDKNAIGYDSLASVDSQVKAMSIEGVQANAASVKDGSYKIQRPFLYLTKGEPTGLAKAFIDYTLSPEGQKIIGDNGAISAK